MNVLDILILVFVLLAVARGRRAGFLLGAFSLAGVALGTALGFMLAPVLAPENESPMVRLNTMLVTIPALAALGWILTRRTAGGSLRSRLSGATSRGLDRLGGALLGLALSLTFVWVVGAFALQTPPLARFQPTVQGSWVLATLNERMPSELLVQAVAGLDLPSQVQGLQVAGVAILTAVTLVMITVLTAWLIWVPTAAVALVGFGLVRLLKWRDLGKPKVVGGFLRSAARERGGLRVTLDEEKVRRYETLRNTIVVAAALGTGAALAAEPWFSFIESYDVSSEIVTSLAGIALAVALVTLIATFLPVRAEQSMNERVEKINGTFASLDEDLERLSALATQLQIDFPVSDYLRQSKEYLDSHVAERGANLGWLEAMLKRAKEGVRDDISHLESALGQYGAAKAAHARASQTVPQSPSLLAVRNRLHDKTHHARTSLLPAREWQTFREAMEASKNANGVFAGLDEDLKRLSALATELEIDFPVSDHLQESTKYLDNRAEGPLETLASLAAVLERAKEGARDDTSRLESALEQLEAAEVAHARASLAVAQSPSLVAAADELYDQIHHARTSLLPTREWQTFREAMEVYCEELQGLEAGNVHGGDGSPGGTSRNGPYQVLGADPSMSTGEIKYLFKKLVNIYHPDKGIVKDDEKFKEIKGAWDAIREERGE